MDKLWTKYLKHLLYNCKNPLKELKLKKRVINLRITEIFEKRFLFIFGRHLWNIAGISGFLAFLAGIVLFINSSIYETPKSSEEFFKSQRTINKKILSLENDQNNLIVDKEIMQNELSVFAKKIKPIDIKEIDKFSSLKSWIKRNKYNISLDPKFNFLDLEEISYLIAFDRSIKLEDKKILENYLRYTKSDQYIKDKSLETEYNDILAKFKNKESKIISEIFINKEKLASRYNRYLDEVNIRNNSKISQRFISPFIVGYGIAVFASSAISSALLSIERNTRSKKDE